MAVVFSGANTHDINLLEATLDHIVVLRPEPDEAHSWSLCLDADYIGSNEKVQSRGYTLHICPRFCSVCLCGCCLAQILARSLLIQGGLHPTYQVESFFPPFVRYLRISSKSCYNHSVNV